MELSASYHSKTKLASTVLIILANINEWLYN